MIDGYCFVLLLQFCFVWLALFGLVVMVCSGWHCLDCLVLLGVVVMVCSGWHCLDCLVLLGLVSTIWFGICIVLLRWHYFVWLTLIGFVWLALVRHSLVWLNDSEPRNPRGVCFTQVL